MRYSKARQTRPKMGDPKPERRLQHNSTFAVSDTPMRKVSKKQRVRLAMDSVCADEAQSRDGYICIAHKWLWGVDVNGTVVHHIKGKNTHHGVDLRFMLLYQITLCDECHNDTESKNGHDRWLDIDAVEDTETSGTQLLRQTKVIDGVRFSKSVERPNITNWNPLVNDDD